MSVGWIVGYASRPLEPSFFFSSTNGPPRVSRMEWNGTEGGILGGRNRRFEIFSGILVGGGGRALYRGTIHFFGEGEGEGYCPLKVRIRLRDIYYGRPMQ